MATATAAKTKEVQEAADITDTRRHYELMLIVSPSEGDQDRVKTVQEWQQIIEKEGGEITHEETIGLRELSYPIKRHERGHYAFIQFLIDPSKHKGIKKKLIVDMRLLRFLLVEIPLQSKIDIFDKDVVYGGAKKVVDDSAVAQEVARQRKQGRGADKAEVSTTAVTAAKPAVKVSLPVEAKAMPTAEKITPVAVVPPIEIAEEPVAAPVVKGDELIKEEHEGAPSEEQRMSDLDKKLKELLG